MLCAKPCVPVQFQPEEADLRFVDDVDARQRDPRLGSTDFAKALAPQPIEVKFTVAEQRAIVQAEAGERCFRMWMTQGEYKESNGLSKWPWIAYNLSDGRVAIWRPESDLTKLYIGGEVKLAALIGSRKLDDSEV